MLPLRVLAFSEPPGRLRLHQVPLSSPLAHRFAPGCSRLSATRAASPSAGLSPSRVPGLDRSHSLGFRFASPCEAGGILRSGCDPDSFRLSQRPLALIRCQVPRAIAVSRYRGCFVVSRVGVHFGQLSLVPVHPFSSSRNPVRLPEASDAAFDRSGRRRPTACLVCTPPLSLRAGKYPLATDARFLRGRPTSVPEDTVMSDLSPECCRLSSRRQLDSHRFRPSPHGAQGHISGVRSASHQSHMLRSACYPC